MEKYTAAKDIASNDLYYIDGLASVKDAVQMMKDKNVRSLIIQKRNEADANGIVTVTDIIKKVIILNKTLEEVSVYEIMTKPVLSIPAQMNIKYIPRLMMNAQIKFAPVEENGNYVGVINYHQFLFNLVE
jgi:signal-transduction protein with cAMP-binding, CBS, and nucleotidyltransferase domain